MPKTASLYPAYVQELIDQKSAVLSKAQAFADIGMDDMARTLWETAAQHEERLAPILESLGHDLEAAVHRISAASCYQRAGELHSSANMYRGALAGPLLPHSRVEVETQLRACLQAIADDFRADAQDASRRSRARTR